MMERVTQFLRRPSVVDLELAHLHTMERDALRRDTFDRRVRALGRRASDVANWCYGGGVKLMQFPAYVFDLLDRHGKPDHSKIGPFLVSQELFWLQAYDVIHNRRPLQASIVIIIAVLSFASMSLMRYFLGRSNTQITSTTSITDERKSETRYTEFTADGVPAESLPSVPGALTPAGEL